MNTTTTRTATSIVELHALQSVLLEVLDGDISDDLIVPVDGRGYGNPTGRIFSVTPLAAATLRSWAFGPLHTDDWKLTVELEHPDADIELLEEFLGEFVTSLGNEAVLVIC